MSDEIFYVIQGKSTVGRTIYLDNTDEVGSWTMFLEQASRFETQLDAEDCLDNGIIWGLVRNDRIQGRLLDLVEDPRRGEELNAVGYRRSNGILERI